MSTEAAIQSGVFLVGCPRSGTTLLQSLLAAHRDIASYPESHFFQTFPRSGKRARLGIVAPGGRQRRQLQQFLVDAGHEEMSVRVPRHALFSRQYVRSFVAILDTLTAQQGKSVWVEKSPAHLRYIDVIQRYIPDAKFIHLIRSGPDVVASLYQVKKDYPDVWRGPLDLDLCIARWNRDVAITRERAGLPHHTVVRYEDLVADPGAELRDVCDFVGVIYAPGMFGALGDAADTVVLDRELWKRGALEGQVYRDSVGRFERIFDEQQKQHIMDRLNDPGL